MPSIEAPTWYERAKFIASSRADDFLKRIDLDEAIADTGSTESPTGHVMLVNISSHMIAEYVATAGDPWMSESRNFEPGWYIVRSDDNGLIWGIGYGIDVTFNEENARADFAEAEVTYAAWDEQ